MRMMNSMVLASACALLGCSQTPEIKTTRAVLERYQQALGGVDAIKRVQSETRRDEFEGGGV